MIIINSPQEALVYGLCEYAGHDVRRADPMKIIKEGSYTHYCPDFWLPGINLWIAVRNRLSDGDREKHDIWRRDNPQWPLLVVNRDCLTRILLGFDEEPLSQKLHRMAKNQAGPDASPEITPPEPPPRPRKPADQLRYMITRIEAGLDDDLGCIVRSLEEIAGELEDQEAEYRERSG